MQLILIDNKNKNFKNNALLSNVSTISLYETSFVKNL